MVQIGDIIMSISRDIMELVRMVMESNNLINNKVGRNTIAPDSDIYKNLLVKATNDGDPVFDIMLNDYLTYIESGRRAGAKFPPVAPIVAWAKKRGIPTDNSTIYLIRRAISRDGIAPRPFMVYVFEEIDQSWSDGWADRIFNKIIAELDKYFNS